MSVREVATIILGTGPAGLTAGLELAEAGQKPILLERGKSAGGLMRSMKRGDFIVDIGRKQMYSRIPEIHALWCRLLGDDYRPYERRIGILFEGNILENSPAYRGPTLGMPPSLVARCGADLMKSWFQGGLAAPKNYEEYWHRRRGKLFTQILTQTFEEKFRGDLWKDMPVPEGEGGSRWQSVFAGVKSKIGTALTPAADEPEVDTWMHPARGTGQIVERLEQEIARHGGEILFQADVTEIKTDGQRLVSVICKGPSGEVTEFRPKHVIASIPIELLAKLVVTDHPVAKKSAGMPTRSAALVYLFLNRPVPFPHSFLEVSDPNLKMGRIANYNALQGDMVPAGKGAVCVEYFCDATDDLMKLSEKEIGELGVKECVEAGLFEADAIADVWPLKFPGADAATDYRDWYTEDRRQLVEALSAFKNLYFANRAGADAASYAGLEAARAILTGDRKRFDDVSDPRHSLQSKS